MLRGIETFMREVGRVILTDNYLPFLLLGVIGAAFVLAIAFEAGPAVVVAVLVMGCFAAVMESKTGGDKN